MLADEEMERGMEFGNTLVTARQNEITSEVCEGLTHSRRENQITCRKCRFFHRGRVQREGTNYS